MVEEEEECGHACCPTIGHCKVALMLELARLSIKTKTLQKRQNATVSAVKLEIIGHQPSVLLFI